MNDDLLNQAVPCLVMWVGTVAINSELLSSRKITSVSFYVLTDIVHSWKLTKYGIIILLHQSRDRQIKWISGSDIDYDIFYLFLSSNINDNNQWNNAPLRFINETILNVTFNYGPSIIVPFFWAIIEYNNYTTVVISVDTIVDR